MVMIVLRHDWRIPESKYHPIDMHSTSNRQFCTGVMWFHLHAAKIDTGRLHCGRHGLALTDYLHTLWKCKYTGVVTLFTRRCNRVVKDIANKISSAIISAHCGKRYKTTDINVIKLYISTGLMSSVGRAHEWQEFNYLLIGLWFWSRCTFYGFQIHLIMNASSIACQRY